MKRLSAVLALSFVATACVAEDEIDQEMLTEYRRALPTETQLAAASPEASTTSALGEPALYPTSSWPIVAGINGSVAGLVTLLDIIGNTPPTVYNSDTAEFVWGPYPDDFGYTAAYIRDAGTEDDFRYHFAFLRGASNDLATLTPVIWGGGTPDESNDDYGVGLALWDFDASRSFEEQYNPDFDPSEHAQGRYATLFGHGPDENDANAELTFVLAAFRNFVPEDSADQAVDLDYLYGRHASDVAIVDFIDYETQIDVSDPKDGTLEDVGVRMAFLNGGRGRAEADAIGGSLPADESFAVTECWDNSLNETFLLGEHLDEDSVVNSWQLGQSSSCGLFDADLDDLMIPSLQDLDSSLLNALFDLATNGAPSE